MHTLPLVKEGNCSLPFSIFESFLPLSFHLFVALIESTEMGEGYGSMSINTIEFFDFPFYILFLNSAFSYSISLLLLLLFSFSLFQQKTNRFFFIYSHGIFSLLIIHTHYHFHMQRYTVYINNCLYCSFFSFQA